MHDERWVSERSQPARGEATTPGDARRLRGVALTSIVAALMLTLLLEALDQTVVGVAMPSIIGALQGFDRYTWVVTAYLLASMTMVPIVGKLSDQFGRKWFLVGGVVVFLLGSTLSGAAATMDQLIVFRAVQGLGAGIGIALVFTVVGDLFPPAERARWQGVFGAVFGFSSVAGPSIGGWLTDHGPLLGHWITEATRWRWVFYVNLPVGLVALAALLAYLPANLSGERAARDTGRAALRRIDFVGAALAATATISLLLGLTWGGDSAVGWSSPQTIGPLAAAVVLYALFFWAERFAAEPILPPDLFRNGVFAAAAVLSLLQMMIMLGLVIYLPLFLQAVLGLSPTEAGAAITPQPVSTVVGALAAGALIGRIGRYRTIALVGACGMAAGTFLLTRLTASTGLAEAIVFMVVGGLGMGVYFPVLMLSSQNAVPRAHLGVGTAAIRYLGQVGGSLGVAIVGTVVNRGLAAGLASGLAARGLPPETLRLASDPQALVNPAVHAALSEAAGAQAPQLFDTLRLALASAIQQGFVVALAFCGVALIATWFLKDVPLTKE